MMKVASRRLSSLFSISFFTLLLAVGWSEIGFAQTADLDHCRNGSAGSPSDCIDDGNTGWVNGNAGASSAHYLETLSIPYRVVMTGLPSGQSITLTLSYDIKHGGKHALDFLTHYDRLEPHAQFGHPKETVDPTSGVSVTSALTTTFPIPAPSATLPCVAPVAGQPTAAFNALTAAEKNMTLFGGTITGIAYVSQGCLADSQAETRISVTFTVPVDNATAVLAFGGHIASANTWNGQSAAAISGSPYHMRLENWTLGSLGNQDRSLSASAVLDPCAGVTCTSDACETRTCVNGLCVPILSQSGTLCRPSGGVCDVAEYCDGINSNCPADLKSTAVCRASSGVCDVAEVCNGVSNECPADQFASSQTMCRDYQGVCDVAEFCTGSSAACPADAKSTAMCREAAGVCDVAEYCNGTSNECPANQFASNQTMCRDYQGVCDVAEYCSGSSATCPADVKSTGMCRAANGDCDVAEYCDGANNTCPGDQVASDKTVCRAASGLCDVTEYCTGYNKICPADEIVAAGTSCRSSAGSCDVPEVCDGDKKECPADVFVTAGMICRGSAGLCDPEEACTGNSPLCPVNVVFDPTRDQSCEAEFCRTAGFWSTHAGAEKKNGKSQNITLAVIDLANGIRDLPLKDLINLNGVYGKLNICGENIVNTQLNDAASALESMCVSPQGDPRLQLVRQLTAASLNCVLSGGNPECIGVDGPSNISIEDLFAACNTACADGGTVVTDGVNTISCIAAVDCWNNGGVFYEATGFCQTGTCSLDGVTACNSKSNCPLYYGQEQSCVALAGTCHDQKLVKDGFFDFDPPGPAGSSDACNLAIGNRCTVIAPGEIECRDKWGNIIDSAP